MSFDHSHYLPCLRWKQGEYQAISRLSPKTKQKITPLIEIPDIGWDFEKEEYQKTVDQHLTDFVKKRIVNKWGAELCFIDLNRIDPGRRLRNGTHPLSFIFSDCIKFAVNAVPVTGFRRDQSYHEAITQVVTKNKLGIGLRLTIEEAATDTTASDIASLLSANKVTAKDCHLILDLNTPGFQPINSFAKVVISIIKNIPHLNSWRTFCLLGTAFPKSMALIKLGGDYVPRDEWQLYKLLVPDLSKERIRIPTFGDYAISHPDTRDDIDMRFMKPPATIRYTLGDKWYIAKGTRARTAQEFRQFRKLCEDVLRLDGYSGSHFSWGDKYINDCAAGTASTGRLTTWRQVGTNHHIEKVVHEIASFYAS